ncbi:MAG TPA: TM2 domain-containing protein [Candidatus Binataceae bacterium]|nr:TM2 domain-containing protein [Candidatus Binataceae bacterium]
MRPEYCPRCGHEIATPEQYCTQCAYPIPPDERYYYDLESSARSRLVALVLCAVFGFFGVHRFYVGKVASGIVWALTGGLIGFGWFIDLAMIGTGTFRDSDGLPLLDWE